MDSIRLKFTLNESIDVVSSLEDVFNSIGEEGQKIRILFYLVTYCVFVSKDLRQACAYVNRIMEYGDRGILCLVSVNLPTCVCTGPLSVGILFQFSAGI